MPEAVKALADLVVDDADKREAAIAVIGGTRDPKWLAFLGALRDGGVYAQARAEQPSSSSAAPDHPGRREVIEISTRLTRQPRWARWR